MACRRFALPRSNKTFFFFIFCNIYYKRKVAAWLEKSAQTTVYHTWTDHRPQRWHLIEWWEIKKKSKSKNVSTGRQTLTCYVAGAALGESVHDSAHSFCTLFGCTNSELHMCIYLSVNALCVCQNMKYLVKDMWFLTLLLWDLSERPFHTTRLTPALFWANSTHNTNRHQPVFWFVMQHVDPGGSPCVSAALPESFLYRTFPGLKFYELLTWRRIQKSSVWRILSRGARAASIREWEPSWMR